MIRIKGGLYPSHHEIRSNNFHTDFPFKHKGCIFYINNNNGPTVNGEKCILSKENRAVLFDPSIPSSIIDFFSTTIFILLPFLFQTDFENALGQSSDAQEAGESNGHGPSCSKPRIQVDFRHYKCHPKRSFFF